MPDHYYTNSTQLNPKHFLHPDNEEENKYFTTHVFFNALEYCMVVKKCTAFLEKNPKR